MNYFEIKLPRNQDNYHCFWHGKLSNWATSHFQEKGNKFISNEQYMMYRKAILFKDLVSAKLILKSTTPKEAKALGRKVKNFDSSVWDENKMQIMVDGLTLKFQIPEFQAILLATENKILIEASPFDTIWGIGIDEKDFFNNKAIKGENLLGIALMTVRDNMKNQ